MTTPLDRYAAQYVQFEDERTRPIRDLLAAVPNTPIHTAIDIGCGPGNSTEALIARAPDATVHGIDASADMIDARARACRACVSMSWISPPGTIRAAMT